MIDDFRRLASGRESCHDFAQIHRDVTKSRVNKEVHWDQGICSQASRHTLTSLKSVQVTSTHISALISTSAVCFIMTSRQFKHHHCI